MHWPYATGAYIVILYGIAVKCRRGQFIAVHVLAGLMLIAMGLLRMGQIISFSHAAGDGLHQRHCRADLSDSAERLFGLPVAQMPSRVFATLQTLNQTKAQFHLATLALSAGCLALILFLAEKLNKLLPAPFVALVLASVLTAALALPVATIGGKFWRHPAGCRNFAC